MLDAFSRVLRQVEPPFYCTLDANREGTNLTLSNNNLTATKVTTNAHANAIATRPRKRGKWYWEVTLTTLTLNNITIGFVRDTSWNSVGAPSVLEPDSVRVNHNGNAAQGLFTLANATTTTMTSGAVIGFALDLDAGMGWFSKAGTYIVGNPAIHTTPSWTWPPGIRIFPYVNLFTSGDKLTINFGDAAFTTNPPAGYSEWNKKTP